MLFALIILYVVTLVYLSVTERFRNYATLIATQGWVLFGIGLFRLHSDSWYEFVFVLTETLLVKALFVPYMLFRIIRQTGIGQVHPSTRSGLNSLIFFVMVLLISVGVTYYIADTTIDVVFFTVAMYALLCGLLLITTHKRIFSHLVGLLVIENGVFLFSLAVGLEMPMLINTAILLDILLTILMLVVFIGKISEQIRSLNADELTSIKD